MEQAIRALVSDVPEGSAIEASAQAVSSRLGIASARMAAPEAITACQDVQRILPAFRAGSLPESRARLIEAHLSECGACLRASRSGSGAAAVDWSAPHAAPARNRSAASWGRPAWGWAVAVSCVTLAIAFVFYKAYWEVPPGVRAEVTVLDGSAYLVTSTGERPIASGGELREGDSLRTTGASHAILRLSDGSRVEVNQRTALKIGARGRNMTVALDNGAVIVDAAHRDSGHLYVKTPDCRATVQGTIFAVDSGLKGSRVAVLQGTVHVAHAGINSVLNPGDQIATSENLGAAPLAQQISWSPERTKYLELLAQLSILQHRIEQIPFPQPRYTSDILPRVPADTLLYVSIPNLGDFLAEANTIFRDQLSQSPALQQWWSHGHEHNTAELDGLVDKLHSVSQYLGDEVVIAGRPRSDRPDFAVLADVQRSGLADLLQQQFAAAGLTVYTEQTLANASDTPSLTLHEYALVRQHEAVFSNSVSALKQWNAQLNAGPTGFAAADFGKQISAAYDRGAGIILAADLHGMMAQSAMKMGRKPFNESALQQSGMESVQYLIAEHRETNGGPENHLNLSFTGTRQRVASWLGAPAPMGSLGFVTPNAAFAAVVLSKDPGSIADDIIAMTSARDGSRASGLSKAEAELQISLRDDLVATLGGEFLVAVDGPVLPTPSWKAVVEVNNPARLENTLERLAAATARHSHDDGGHVLTIEPSDVSGQRYYAVRDSASGLVVASYTFSAGYMVLAPDRPLLIEALRTEASGVSLARSASFRALLPKDDNENYSAVAYQNLSPVLTPLLSQLSGESAEAIRKLAADARPTAVCAWGKDSRIEVATDSRMFGFDFLTLGALLDSRNKLPNPRVTP